MSPTSSYGRNKRAYRYYVSTALQRGGSAAVDDTLRRIPGQSAGDLILAATRRLARRVVSAQEVRAVLQRVEIHAECVHLHLLRRALVGQARDAQSDLELIERRLLPGERLSTAPGDAAVIQVVLALLVRSRGGRSWITLPDGRSPLTANAVDAALVQGLSRAHAIAAEIGLRSDGRPRDGQKVKAPASAYQRILVKLAFLAPDIQAAIVAGRQPASLKLEHFLRSETPLAWADQGARYGFRS